MVLGLSQWSRYEVHEVLGKAASGLDKNIDFMDCKVVET